MNAMKPINLHIDNHSSEALFEDRNILPAGSNNHESSHDLKTPETLEDTGLSKTFIFDLILKHLYRFGQMNGTELSDHLKIPFYTFDFILDDLIAQNLIEKKGGRGIGNSHDIFALLQNGYKYTQSVLEKDTYTGPCPVTLKQYSSYMRKLAQQKTEIHIELLREIWSNFILDDVYISEVGPAICSGSSCFLYGPPGTGKTVLAKAIADCLYKSSSDIGIPHAIIVGGYIIRLYDPIYHESIESTTKTQYLKFDLNCLDRRWVRCKRPTVIAGGELTMSMLDLQFNITTRYYEAPIQMKANGGVLIIDDFGRQQVKPRNLLNRWILPLEEKIDYLSLHTGKKFPIPFEQFVIFATNLQPQQLVDEAFLRRIRYKIYISIISIDAYKKIFRIECEKKNLEVDEKVLDEMIQKFYIQKKIPLRACDPRDITDKIRDYCTFNRICTNIDKESLMHIFDNYLEHSYLK